jgi:hypothetical protein
LTKLAKIADQILDHNMQSQVTATNNPLTSSQQTSVDFSEERLAKMEKQLSELATTVNHCTLDPMKSSKDKRLSDFLFVIKVEEKEITISVERLKPAYIAREDSS